MKLNPHQNSTQQQIFRHPWYEATEAKPPNPPTKEAIEKAKFVDKTYKWTGR